MKSARKYIRSLLFFVFFGTIILSQTNTTNSSNQPSVSVHAEDTHLPTILSMLAKQSGYNIVTGPNVQTQEKLTIHLDDVPISQALNLVIRASGLSYEIIGNSILVAKKSRLDKDIGLKPHVISLDYANADDVAKLLDHVSSTITIDKAGNNILVNASPKKIDEIEKIIEEIDKPAIQIMLEARLIEVSITDKEEMGIDWERLASTSIIFAESGVSQQLTGNLLTGSALPGYSWELMDFDGDGISDFPYENIEGQPYSQLPTEMAFTRETGIQPFGRQLTAFDLTLDMLIKDNRANILTNSQVVTLNGHKATIDMVEEIPYVAQSGGIGGTVQVLKEIAGIRLNILPTVNSDGYITTEVIPEVSSIVEFTSLGYPRVKKRKSKTTIRVKDGETIVIGGLVSSEKINTESKFPILWRIPWIGKRLFTHTEEEDKKTDLIIQVKPTIVKDNYSGIKKQYYHIEAEKRLIVADPAKIDSTLIDSSLIK